MSKKRNVFAETNAIESFAEENPRKSVQRIVGGDLARRTSAPVGDERLYRTAALDFWGARGPPACGLP